MHCSVFYRKMLHDLRIVIPSYVSYALMFRIVLDAGYFLHIRAFFDNFGTILLYAVVVSITCNYFLNQPRMFSYSDRNS